MGRVFTTPRKSFEYNFYERSTLQLVPLTHSQVLRVYHIYGRVFASFVYTMPRHLSVCAYVIDPPVHLIIPSLFACPLNGVMDHVTLNPSVHTHGYIKRGRYVYGESCTLQCTEPHTHARTLVSFVFVAAKKIKIKNPCDFSRSVVTLSSSNRRRSLLVSNVADGFKEEHPIFLLTLWRPSSSPIGLITERESLPPVPGVTVNYTTNVTRQKQKIIIITIIPTKNKKTNKRVVIHSDIEVLRTDIRRVLNALY